MAAARGGPGDVAFLDAVVAIAAQRLGLDTSRVGVTGMSKGALMALARRGRKSPIRLRFRRRLLLWDPGDR